MIQYFREWSRLLNLEDRDLHKHLRHFYDTAPAVREAMGMCASNLKLLRNVVSDDAATAPSSKYPYVYEFVRRPTVDGSQHASPVSRKRARIGAAAGLIVASAFSPSVSQTRMSPDVSSQGSNYPSTAQKGLDVLFEVGRRVTLSIEGRHVGASAQCVVSKVGTDSITIACQNMLPSSSSSSSAASSSSSSHDVVWCVDREVFQSGMKKARQNLRMLCLGPLVAVATNKHPGNKTTSSADPRVERVRLLRDLLVQVREPLFRAPKAAAALAAADAAETVAAPTAAADRPWLNMYPRNYGGGPQTLTLPKPDKLRQDICQLSRTLNGDQCNAVEHVLRANDYSLLLGMPGTGKTTTIVFLLRLLIARGARVLLAAYTNSAVDNVLLKLKEQGFDEFVRVGNPNSMRAEIKPHSLQEQCRTLRESDRSLRPVETVDRVMTRNQLVASTCLSATDPVLSGVSGGQKAALQQAAALGIPAYDPTLFDYCIVDEASQIHEPVCVGPLLRARRFVLVGDPNQLSAVVKSRTAVDLGMGKSLFERLGDAHPHAVCRLRTQYRMNRDITKLANALVYQGELECGTPAVSSQRLIIKGSVLSDPAVLPLPRQRTQQQQLSQQQAEPRVHWLKTVLSTNRSVVFVDTDDVRKHSSAHEIRQSHNKRKISAGGGGATAGGHQFEHERNRFSPMVFHKGSGGLTNAVEVKIVRLIVQGLANCGVDCNDVGVISPYRSQLKLITRALRHLPEVEVNTVDSYQGRDKKCIVLSLVRSNASGEIGRLLKDWRRINVAFTRAKMKLIIIGSGDTLRNAGRGGKKEKQQEVEAVDKSSSAGAKGDCSSASSSSSGSSSSSSSLSSSISGAGVGGGSGVALTALGAGAGEETIRKFMQIVVENRWLYKLPRNADQFYPALERVSRLHSQQLREAKQQLTSAAAAACSSPSLLAVAASKGPVRVVANPRNVPHIRGGSRKANVNASSLSVGAAVMANIPSAADVKQSLTPA